MLISASILDPTSNLNHRKYIVWSVYNGDDILDAKSVADYVTTFFKTGEVMPIPIFNLGLNIHSVQTEYNDELGVHKVIIEGIVVDPRLNYYI